MIPTASIVDQHPSDAYLDSALAYAARGWSIIPTIGKRAAGLWKPFQDRPADERTLRRMFSRKGITGLAVILGRASGGLGCRDFDRADAYLQWAAAHPDLASVLPTVKTARGHHVYFRGQEGFANLGDGEYRADSGHYCLLPPSAHPDGPPYRWMIPLSEGDLPLIDPVHAGLLSHTQAHSLHVSHEDIRTSIMATQPSGVGQRNRLLFDLARRLKSLIPAAAPDSLEQIVREWHSLARPIIATKDWTETWLDFRTAWANVRRPAGATMAEIVAKFQARVTADADAIVKLSELCRVIQEHHGEGRAWPLSCRVAGHTIGVGHATAARILKLLCREGTIEIAEPPGPEGSGKATEYRFIGGVE